MKKHLWEIKHSYYCSDSNYCSNECTRAFGSFGEFLSEFGDADFDMNLLFRWDWCEGDDHGLPEYNGDDYYRNGRLQICWMGQRKGLYFTSFISVCRADEPEVIKFLKPRFDHLVSLWEGITP